MLQRAGLTNTETQTVRKLRSDLRKIFNLLPQDVQQMLLTSPNRAGLLQGGREVPKGPGKSPSGSGRGTPSPLAKIRQMIDSMQTGVKATGDPSRTEELLHDPLDLNRT